MAVRRARRAVPIQPPSDTDAQCAARHLCVVLVTERPDLWPTLNIATLRDAIDWAATLRLLVKVAEKGPA